MSLPRWITACVKAFQRPAPSPPASAVPVTALVPSCPLNTAVPPPRAVHPDMPLIMREFHAHERNHPHLTWAEFVKILEHREQFFGEERREREAKLAKLNSVTRFKL